MQKTLLAFDQGTTSSRSILFDTNGNVQRVAQKEFPQIHPADGHVEHDPEAIWATQFATAKEVIDGTDIDSIAAIGITNQRETTVLWDRSTGNPIANAIVWQSRISNPICERLKNEGLEPTFRSKTGLVLDPYFSGTKIRFLLDSDAALQKRAEDGEILFGTIDSFLIWRLTGGKSHVIDVSNASRTLLFNLHEMQWDSELLKILNIPEAMLPKVVPSSSFAGETDAKHFGRAIPIMGVAGDQQAATFGQSCFAEGEAKNTYGTGCFLMMNVGSKPVASENGLLTTVGWQVNDKVTYCLEGSVFVAGSLVQWLRDKLGIIQSSSEIESLANQCESTGDLIFVPAFVGLGAPYWNPNARGAIFGMSHETDRTKICKAALEAIAFQSFDLVSAMEKDSGGKMKALKVDGGAAANNLMMQFQADLIDTPILRPKVTETTAWGAASLAGLAAGVWADITELQQNWQLDCRFDSKMHDKERTERTARWHQAISQVCDWSKV